MFLVGCYAGPARVLIHSLLGSAVFFFLEGVEAGEVRREAPGWGRRVLLLKALRIQKRLFCRAGS